MGSLLQVDGHFVDLPRKLAARTVVVFEHRRFAVHTNTGVIIGRIESLICIF